MSINIADIRKEYARQQLSEQEVEANPVYQFQKWLDEAISAQVMEPTAMNLATVSKEGRPSSRILLLKGITGDQFIFFTNYSSKKGQDIQENNFGAMTFFWPELERQVRIEGIISKVDSQVSDEYFQSRPRESRIGAWASLQSKPLTNRQLLEEKEKSLKKQFENQDIPRPSHWGGYALTPDRIEFWQGRPSRLHDRIIYELNQEGNWKVFRLFP
jgi:pyridoxamine 5'-phosphate oxidase